MAKTDNSLHSAASLQHARDKDSAAGRRLNFSVIRRLLPYFSGHWKTLLLLAIAMLLSNVLSLLTPLLSGRAIDAIGTKAGQVDFAGVWRNCLQMLLCYLLSSILAYFLSARLIRVSQDVSYALRRDVFDKLSRLPVRYFDTHPAGDLISRISYDVDTVNTSLSTDLVQMLTSVVTVVGSLVMLLSISPLLSLVFLFTVPASIFFSRWQLNRVRPLFRRRSEALGTLSGFTEESISALRTVRAYGRERAMQARFSAHNAEAIEAYRVADRESCILGPSVNFINNFSLAFISVFGALLFLSGRLTLGSVSSFVLYSRKFSGPIREAANIVTEIQAAATAAERVFRLIDETPESLDAPDAAPLPHAEGNVSFDGVSFGYEKDVPVLSDLTLDVPQGSLIAIVGPTGAGKTTIVNLLMRFYDTDAGAIFIDGKDVRDIVRNDLRRSYAMVLQDTWLFYGTIYENLAYGNPVATRERVIEAAKAAHIHAFIESLPDGYDTILTDDGLNISKGQKQLLTIARAMLLESSMLILDEATSNVDTSTELAITESMQLLMRGKTCFVIAHRLSTIRRADRILVIEHGRVIEQGTHDALLQRGGAYKRLYLAQFEIE